MSKQNALVLEGTQIKARLQADAAEKGSFVHIDWLRMTFNERFLPVPGVDFLFPKQSTDIQDQHYGKQGAEAIHGIMFPQLADLPKHEQHQAAVAWGVADEITALLGVGFTVDLVRKPGRDFYKYRYAILRNGMPVGWVGFLSMAKGKYASQQDKTVHVNLEGMACTFAQPQWLEYIADYVEKHRGQITRCDLALDFFDGIKGGFERLKTDYTSGLMDHLGKRPKCKAMDEWGDQNEGRSVYLGSRQAGKLTNIYEKGKQLFGAKDATNWWRAELRYGNQLRVIPSDILRRPADFFAGASDWHASLLAEHGEAYRAERIQCTPKLQQETIDAEVSRNVRWFLDTASSSALLALKYLPQKVLDELFDEGRKLPSRLRKFTEKEVAARFAACFETVTGNTRAAGMLTA